MRIDSRLDLSPALNLPFDSTEAVRISNPALPGRFGAPLVPDPDPR
jgi:hypothetical protein